MSDGNEVVAWIAQGQIEDTLHWDKQEAIEASIGFIDALVRRSLLLEARAQIAERDANIKELEDDTKSSYMAGYESAKNEYRTKILNLEDTVAEKDVSIRHYQNNQDKLQADLVSAKTLLSEQHGQDACLAHFDVKTNGAVCVVCLQEEISERDARIRELEARLEVSPDHPYDGIACRDETIKLLDEKVTKLEADLATARAQQVPEGWQLVPKEPTREMLTAIANYPDSYRAMLAAAPKPYDRNKPIDTED